MRWEYIEYRPNYELYNKKSAPIIRNKMIIDQAEYIIAYWNGESKGTAQAIEYAKKKDKKGIIKIPKEKQTKCVKSDIINIENKGAKDENSGDRVKGYNARYRRNHIVTGKQIGRAHV